MQTVKEMIKEWLDQHGYDGLVLEEAECGCDKNDLFCANSPLCGEMNCVAGVYREDEQGEFIMHEAKGDVDHADKKSS